MNIKSLAISNKIYKDLRQNADAPILFLIFILVLYKNHNVSLNTFHYIILLSMKNRCYCKEMMAS